MLVYYQRNLPHRLPPGETIFVTFRLADSLPAAVLARLRQEWSELPETVDAAVAYARQRRYFGKFDDQLDVAATGPVWLSQATIAQLVQQALHWADERKYQLVCYAIMPNHVHLVVSLPDVAPSLARTLQALKGYTGHAANTLLGRTGQFWQRESYDHVVRSGPELERVIAYVINNPVKAGLTDDWQKWPFTYWKPE